MALDTAHYLRHQD